MSRTTTPTALAARLGVAPLALRNWLREVYPRNEHEKYQRWVIDSEMERRAIEHFRSRY